MKAHYRGYTISAKRERALGGWDNLYYSIYRDSDGREMVCNFTTGEDTVRDYILYMKERIDAEHATPDPWDECAEELRDLGAAPSDEPMPPEFIERMVAAGYIERLPDRWELTEEGRKAMARHDAFT